MRFGVFMCGIAPKYAHMSIETMRYHHPHAEIIHLTDHDTAQLPGTDTVIRRMPSKHLIRTRTQHLAEIDDEPFISIDTDMLVCAPLDEAFDGDFDVGLTTRPDSTNTYNCGIMFSKCAQFWRELYTMMERRNLFEYFGGMETAIKDAVDPQKWRIKKLRGEVWNCSDFDHLEGVKVLHYKGDRKLHMYRHYEQGVWQ